MTDSIKRDSDWSARHLRLRFELVIISIILFMYARFDIQISKLPLIDIDIQAIDQSYIVSTLSAIYLYLFIMYILRTRIESRAISSYWEYIAKYIDDVSAIRKELIAYLRGRSTSHAVRNLNNIHPVDALDIKSRLGNINTAVRELKGSFSHIEDFKIRIEESGYLYNNVKRTTVVEKGISGELLNINVVQQNFLRHLRQTEKIFLSIGDDINALLLISENVGKDIESIRSSIDSIRSFYGVDMESAIKSNNERLNEFSDSIGRIELEIRRANSALNMERYYLSMALPVIISLLLIVVSLDRIIGDSVKTLFALRSAFYSMI